MSSPARPRLRFADLGATEQSAVRRLLDLFRDHGWSDSSNAALATVRRLTGTTSGVTPGGLASSMPESFYLKNSVTRKQVTEALGDLVNSPSHR